MKDLERMEGAAIRETEGGRERITGSKNVYRRDMRVVRSKG